MKIELRSIIRKVYGMKKAEQQQIAMQINSTVIIIKYLMNTSE